MKGTKVLTLGAGRALGRYTIVRIMRMRTANYWDGPSNAVRNLPLNHAG